MSDFLKDPGGLDSLNLSEISDVDPDEIQKIVKSASELDKKYGIRPPKHQEGSSSKLVPVLSTDNILDQLNISTNNEFQVKSEDTSSRKRGNISITKSNEGPIGYGIKLDNEGETKVERKSRGSADWLGLKDSPVKQPSFDADDYMRPKTSSPTLKPSSTSGTTQLSSLATRPATAKPQIQNLLSNTENKGATQDSEDIPLPSDSPLTMSLRHKSAAQVNRNKGKLIDELFGEAKLTGEDSFRIGVEAEPSKPSEGSQGDSYMPSATVGRRLERRGAPAKKSSSGLDSDFDWLLGSKSTSETTKEPPKKSSVPAQATVTAPTVSSASETKISTPNAVKKENKVPDWLEGIIPDTPKKEEVRQTVFSDKPVSAQASKLPEWLNGTSQVDPLAPQEVVTSNQEFSHNPPIYQNVSLLKLSDDNTNSIAARLASIQKELGDAISKRNQNLQVYMQVLIQEAQKVVSLPDALSGNKYSTENNKEENSESGGKGNMKSEENKVDKKSEIIKHQEDLIHDFEININRLELQNTQLEMKIENLKSVHEMEIEMIKKNHGYEISSWESRLERMKTSFEETIEDYKTKVDKLKENEENLIAEHKERLRKMEEERAADLEKLGEFHRIAIEQAANLTVSMPNINQSFLRLPLKFFNRPKDEVEMSERETVLLEKERQIEVLKAAVEAEKRELDEALEIEKIRREERERDLRRQATEIRLREEARLSEAKRERDQFDAISLQIKLMREEALKEQGELAKEKLELAAERARLEATYSIQGRSEASIPPLDIMQARAEVEAALETARQAKEAAEQERRRQVELRQAVDQITWEQKEMDLRLENREKHLSSMLHNAEKMRHEGLAALEEAKSMKEELDLQSKDIKEQIKQIETKEKILARERLEIAKEKIELERRRAQLDIILPELNPAEELTLHPPKTFVDPKAVIMRLKAEKELESFITNQNQY